eukprot:1700054-Prymnesium_polylepis.1
MLVTFIYKLHNTRSIGTPVFTAGVHSPFLHSACSGLFGPLEQDAAVRRIQPVRERHLVLHALGRWPGGLGKEAARVAAVHCPRRGVAAQ